MATGEEEKKYRNWDFKDHQYRHCVFYYTLRLSMILSKNRVLMIQASLIITVYIESEKTENFDRQSSIFNHFM